MMKYLGENPMKRAIRYTMDIIGIYNIIINAFKNSAVYKISPKSVDSFENN